MLSRQIERAQRKVEAYNFDLRKNLLEYDDVANDQRKVIYQQRTELMAAEDISDSDHRHPRGGGRTTSSTSTCRARAPEEQWNLAGLTEAIEREFWSTDRSEGLARGRSRASPRRACATASSQAVEAAYEAEGRRRSARRSCATSRRR